MNTEERLKLLEYKVDALLKHFNTVIEDTEDLLIDLENLSEEDFMEEEEVEY